MWGRWAAGPLYRAHTSNALNSNSELPTVQYQVDGAQLRPDIDDVPVRCSCSSICLVVRVFGRGDVFVFVIVFLIIHSCH